MGQQIGLRKRLIIFRPNSIISASDMAFFSKFSWRQISATFRLEIGQWEGLPWRCIVFQPNSIVSVSEIAFFENFVSVLIFLCVKIQFRLNWCNFSIGNRVMGRTPEENHHFSAKFYRFSLRNCIFLKIFVSVLFFFFCARIQFEAN